jgi:ribonuclease HI
MKVQIEWIYKHPNRSITHPFTSGDMSLTEALQVADDLERTGRVKSLTFRDHKGVTWSKKELLRLTEEKSTTAHNIRCYCDGGYDRETGLAGIGIVIYYAQNGKEFRIRENQVLQQIQDNNEAEYAALLALFQRLQALDVRHEDVTIYLDSLVVQKQASEEWPVYEMHYHTWLDRMEQIISSLHLTVRYELISRENNQEADRLATQALEGTMVNSHAQKEGQHYK